MSKTSENNEYLLEKRKEGYEYCFVSELPYPKLRALAKVCSQHILAQNGNVLLLRTFEEHSH